MKKIDYYNTILRSKFYGKHGREYYMITTIDECTLYNKIMRLSNGDSVEELNEEEWELFNKTFRKKGLIEWYANKKQFVIYCDEIVWHERDYINIVYIVADNYRYFIDDEKEREFIASIKDFKDAYPVENGWYYIPDEFKTKWADTLKKYQDNNFIITDDSNNYFNRFMTDEEEAFAHKYRRS